MERLDILNRDREALSDLFVSLSNLPPAQYNALVHAIWRIDAEIKQLTDNN